MAHIAVFPPPIPSQAGLLKQARGCSSCQRGLFYRQVNP